MCPRQIYYTENTEAKEAERKETEKNIYRNRKASHLSTHGGLKEEGSHS